MSVYYCPCCQGRHEEGKENCPEFILFGPEAEEQRFKQMDINFRFLLSGLDAIHGFLCPDETGTWQQRTTQVINAAKRLRT